MDRALGGERGPSSMGSCVCTFVDVELFVVLLLLEDPLVLVLLVGCRGRGG